jgi:hypothetical protein
VTDKPLDNPQDNAYIKTELEEIEALIVAVYSRVEGLGKALQNLIRTLPEAERKEGGEPIPFIQKKRRKGIQ